MTVLVTRGDGTVPDGTARLVPSGALLYVHASTNESRGPDRQMLDLAGRFASLRLELARAGMAFTPPAGALELARDVRPWLGDEAALALLDGGPGRPVAMVVAAVRDRGPAEAMLARLGATRAGTHHGVALMHLAPRTTAAFAGSYLVAGPEDAVRGAIDRAAGIGGPSLADARVYRRAAELRDRGATVDLFAPAAGLRRLLDGRTGLAGIAGRLVTSPLLEGVVATANPAKGGLRVKARILRAPGGAPPRGFKPTFAARVPAGTAGFVDLPGMGAVTGLAARAGAGAFLAGLRDALPAAAGLELADVLAPLEGEAAISVTATENAPVITLAASTRDPARTRDALARLQAPLADRLAGGAPFEQGDAAGISTFSLDATPRLQPSWAVANGTLVASTARPGLDQLRPARSPLTKLRALERVAPEKGVPVEALVFLDPRQLLGLGERTGLQGLGSPALRDDMRRIGSVGAVVEEDAYHTTDTTAELFLEIP